MNSDKELDEILVSFLRGLPLSSGQALDPKDGVGSIARCNTIKELLAWRDRAVREAIRDERKARKLGKARSLATEKHIRKSKKARYPSPALGDSGNEAERC